MSMREVIPIRNPVLLDEENSRNSEIIPRHFLAHSHAGIYLLRMTEKIGHQNLIQKLPTEKFHILCFVKMGLGK